MPITIPQKKSSSGGGGIGSVLGAIGGCIASIATGGAALPLMAAGASLGGTAGGMIAPPKGGASSGGGALSSALGAAGDTSSAISRAIENRSSDPVQAIKDGIMATAYMPPGQARAAALAPQMRAFQAAVGFGPKMTTGQEGT